MSDWRVCLWSVVSLHAPLNGAPCGGRQRWRLTEMCAICLWIELYPPQWRPLWDWDVCSVLIWLRPQWRPPQVWVWGASHKTICFLFRWEFLKTGIPPGSWGFVVLVGVKGHQDLARVCWDCCVQKGQNLTEFFSEIEVKFALNEIDLNKINCK